MYPNVALSSLVGFFCLGHYPQTYQPPNGVYLLNMRNILRTHRHLHALTLTYTHLHSLILTYLLSCALTFNYTHLASFTCTYLHVHALTFAHIICTHLHSYAHQRTFPSMRRMDDFHTLERRKIGLLINKNTLKEGRLSHWRR